MKSLLTLFSIIYSLSLMAQTSIIAHKSRSGSMAQFSALDYADNLGIPPARLTEVIKLDDSTALLVWTQPMVQSRKTLDTLRSNPIEKYMESFLEYRSLDRINLVGFDSLKQEILLKRNASETEGTNLLIGAKQNSVSKNSVKQVEGNTTSLLTTFISGFLLIAWIFGLYKQRSKYLV